ncbi:Kinesin-like protein kif2a [Cichlidogyrus casuarinus]|uniref:Kinesin-like protein kif2a n=1 Tax=Cichlidogyrus casuarinus TaxID=1844966 RepID=A0ABD2QFV1_9PLAT
MSDGQLQLLEIGLKIDIKRTDGRVHSAVISAVDLAAKYVKVEWYEKGEAKGKDVDFQDLFELNKHLELPKVYHIVEIVFF